MPKPTRDGLAIFAVSHRGSLLGRRIQARLDGELRIPERLLLPPEGTPHNDSSGLRPHPNPLPEGEGTRDEVLPEGEGTGPCLFGQDPAETSGDGRRSVVPYPEGGIRGALGDAFVTRKGLVLILPVGAAVRLIAPLLVDKHSDPAVVAVDEAGAYAVSLVSGHEGGANELARRVAAAIDAEPVITTAAEALDTLALDLLGKDWGWSIENHDGLTAASLAVIDGEPVGVFQDAGEEDWWDQAPTNVVRYDSLDELHAAPLAARLVISDRLHTDSTVVQGPCVVYRPRTLVIGVGCVRGATRQEIEALVGETLTGNDLSPASVVGLATIDVKQDEPGILEVSERRGWPLRFFGSVELAAIELPSGISEAVERAVGAPGVCEPAALLAAGPGAAMVVPKVRTSRVTVAVARAASRRYPDDLAASQRGAISAALSASHTRGQGQGLLSVVGIGPGAVQELTDRARKTLEEAEAIVGYNGYLDYVRPWLPTKTYYGSPIGDEIERCRLAISLSRHGQPVALVSSGDAGIYGTAGIVFELLAEDRAEEEADRVQVVAGISAASTAAALLGAPLMSDFAAISLSDLLTPRETIARRVEAIAASDMVVALYNPASTRRREPLAAAYEVLCRYRSPDTPVGIVRNASRPGQQVTITDLGHLEDHPIDMLTIIVVGNSATVRVGNRMTTRRGYQVTPEHSVEAGARSKP